MELVLDSGDAALRQGANSLSQSTDLLGDLAKDPKGLLGKLDLTVDDETAKRISDRAAACACRASTSLAGSDSQVGRV